MITCPMCGQEVADGTPQCLACGERFAPVKVGDGSFRPTTARIADILRLGWTLYRTQGLMLAAGSFLFLTTFGALYVAMNLAIYFSIDSALLQPGNRDLPLFAIGIVLLALGVFLATVSFAVAGHTLFYLNAVRGRPPKLSDLLPASRVGFRIFGGASLIGTFAFGMAVFLLVPLVMFRMLEGEAIFYASNGVHLLMHFCLGLFLWPFPFRAVDQNSSLIRGLTGAFRLTWRNMLTGFLVSYVFAIPLVIVPAAACCLPAVVTLPLYMSFQVVAYTLMCGREVRIAE